MNQSTVSPRHRGRGAVTALGLFLILLGLPQIIGGAWLIALGGSWYSLPAGIALVVSGIALTRGLAIGAWIYLLFFAATALWSWWEVGTNGWGLLPRLFGLMLLLLLVLLALPRLDPPIRSRPPAFLGYVVLLITLGTFGVGLAHATRVLVSAPVPAAAADRESPLV